MACGFDLSSLKKVIAWQPFSLMRAVALASFTLQRKTRGCSRYRGGRGGREGGTEGGRTKAQ